MASINVLSGDCGVFPEVRVVPGNNHYGVTANGSVVAIVSPHSGENADSWEWFPVGSRSGRGASYVSLRFALDQAMAFAGET